MSLGFFRGLHQFGRAGAIVSLALALAMATQGCGSSSPREASTPLTGVDRAKVLSDKNIEQYEGEGKNKRKIELTHRERRKLLNQAAKEAAKGAEPDSK